jgi:predicted nucleic acid-binding protein
MKSMVLDTSVAIAWYLPESFSPEARRWRRRMIDGDAEFIVPGLHYWEFANMLRTYVMRGEIEEDLATDIYQAHLAAPLVLQEPDRASVLATAFRFGATAYDAVFISLALGVDMPFLMGERTTTPWVVKLGKRVVTLG